GEAGDDLLESPGRPAHPYRSRDPHAGLGGDADARPISRPVGLRRILPGARSPPRPAPRQPRRAIEEGGGGGRRRRLHPARLTRATFANSLGSHRTLNLPRRRPMNWRLLPVAALLLASAACSGGGSSDLGNRPVE